MKESIKKYDGRGNLVYCRKVNGYEQWQKFNKNDVLIYFRISTIKEFEFRQQEKDFLKREPVSRFELMEI